MDYNIRFVEGDCLRRMGDLERESIGSILCDPPYGLKFLGESWDHGVPGVPFWRAALRVARPGAHLAAFGGTRTFHRLATAIEDAGWELRDTLMWLYGSGFPKGRDISKAIDKKANAERPLRVKTKKGAGSGGPFGHLDEPSMGRDIAHTDPGTAEAKEWDGWNTQLKPAYEMIIVARKPLGPQNERDIIVENLIQLEAQLWSLLPVKAAVESFGLSDRELIAVSDSVRWNASERAELESLRDRMDTSRFVTVMTTCLSIVKSWRTILDESSVDPNTSITAMGSSTTTDWKTLRSCSSALTPRSIVEAAIRQPGSWWLALPVARTLNAALASIASIPGPSAEDLATSTGEGGALRPDWRPIILARKPLAPGLTVEENILEFGCGALNVGACRIPTAQTDLGRYPANLILDDEASRRLDAEAGERPGDSPNRKPRVNSSSEMGFKADFGDGVFGTAGYTDSGGPSRFFYCAKCSARERGHYNGHKTVKPFRLMQWLVRLVSPPKLPLLDPFCGSGSTLMAARVEGIMGIGIDLSSENITIAHRRVAEVYELIAPDPSDETEDLPGQQYLF